MFLFFSEFYVTNTFVHDLILHTDAMGFYIVIEESAFQ